MHSTNLLSDGLWNVASVPCSCSSARPLNKNQEICGDLHRDLDPTPDSFNALDTCMLFRRTSVYRQPSCRFTQPHHAFRPLTQLRSCWKMWAPAGTIKASGSFSQIPMSFPPHPDGRASPDFRERLKDSSRRISLNDTIWPTVHGNGQSLKNIWNRRITRIPAGLFTDALPGLELKFWRIPTDPNAAFTPECTQIFMEPLLRTNNLQVPQKTLSTLSSSLCPPRLPYHSKPHSSRNCREQGGNMDQLDNHLFIYTCRGKKKITCRSGVETLCFPRTLSLDYWAALPTCLSCIYCMIYLKQGALFFCLPSCGRVAIDWSQSSTHSKSRQISLIDVSATCATVKSGGGNQHISPHQRAPGRVGRMFTLRRRWLCYISKDYFPAALNETINPHTPKKSKEICAGIHVRFKV